MACVEGPGKEPYGRRGAGWPVGPAPTKGESGGLEAPPSSWFPGLLRKRMSPESEGAEVKTA